MRVRFYIDKWLNTLSHDSTIRFNAISSITNLSPTFENYNITRLIFTKSGDTSSVSIYINIPSTLLLTLTNNDMLDLSSSTSMVIDFNSITNFTNCVELIEQGIVDFQAIEDDSGFLLFRQKSDNHFLSKDLAYLRNVSGKFNNIVNLKNPVIDFEKGVSTTGRNFNYVYSTDLKRFYYVDRIELISSKIVRVYFKEDVLCSWSTLIKNQKMFVSRYENASTENYIVDTRKPLEDKLTTEYITPSSTSIGTEENISFTPNTGCWVITAYSNVSTSLGTNATPTIDASGLPTLQYKKSRKLHYYMIDNITDYESLVSACLGDSETASFIKSIVWLPFVLDSTVFNLESHKLYVGSESKHLGTGGFVTETTTGDVYADEICLDSSPYLCIKDFIFNNKYMSNLYLGLPPYTTYELYLPFYGWYKIENPEKLFDHRLLVYYSIEFETGISTVYVYDYTTHKLIFSGNCTLGIKMDVIITNALENTRQKQINDLSMILSLIGCTITSSLTGNMMVAGMSGLTAFKTIASTIQKNGNLFERASIAFGSSDNSLHSPMNVVLRRTFRQEIVIVENVYKELQGLPYNKYVENLNGMYGYIEVPEIHFNPQNELIYQEEIDEIILLLKNGVVI